MPDLAALAELVEGLRADRQAHAIRTRRLECAHGMLLVHGSDADRVVDVTRLTHIETAEGRIHFVLSDGSRVVGNTSYSIPGLARQLAEFPQLVQVHDDYLANMHFVRGVEPAPPPREGKQLVMATGLPALPLASEHAGNVRSYFDVRNLTHVVPWNERYQGLLDENIREFDTNITRMSVDDLRREFRYRSTDKLNQRELMANAIWQYRTWIALPPEDPHHKKPLNGNIRTFWYYLKPTFYRLGELDANHQYEVMLDIFNVAVAEKKLFRYRDFGFSDECRRWWELGSKHPHIILVAEKRGQYDLLIELQERFGFTVIALGGQPSKLTAEYFYDVLAERFDPQSTTLRHISLVDYDPSGNDIIEAFMDDLTYLGAPFHQRLDVVLPSRFDPEELSAVAIEVPLKTQGDRTKAKRWITQCNGGIGGKPLGIECEALIQADLLPGVVAELFAQALEPIPTPPPRKPEFRASLGLPEAFSAEMLEPDPDDFWDRWAAKLPPTDFPTG